MAFATALAGPPFSLRGLAAYAASKQGMIPCTPHLDSGLGSSPRAIQFSGNSLREWAIALHLLSGPFGESLPEPLIF